MLPNSKSMPNAISIWIFLFGIVAFTTSLQPEFIAFQTRFALFAKQMLVHGPSWFPVTFQGPYPDYPALSTVMIYLLSLPIGEVTPFTAILPTAIAASFTLVVIFKIGELIDQHFAWFAVLFALLTEYYVFLARSITPDFYVTLITSISFYIVVKQSNSLTKEQLMLLAILLMCSFAFRGPIGLVIPAGVISMTLLFNRKYRSFLQFGLLAFATLLISTGLLLLAAYQTGGQSFVYEVLDMQVFGRIPGGEGLLPVWFYFVDSLGTYALAYPISIIVLVCILPKIIRPNNKEALLLKHVMIWFFVVLIGMSIPASKKVRYILPMLPAASLIAAKVMLPRPDEKSLKFFQSILGLLFYAMPWLIVFSLLYANYYLVPSYPFINIHLIPLSVLFCIIGIMQIYFCKQTSSRLEANKRLMSFAVVCFLIVNIVIVDKINYQTEQTKPFADLVVRLAHERHANVVFYRIGPDAEDIKFLVNVDKPFYPTFIYHRNDLNSYSKKTLFIAKQSDFKQLPPNQVTRLLEGKIGHKDCVVFSRK